MTDKMTLADLQQVKKEGRKIKMLTAYDFTMARLIDRAPIDLILVGDSLANVVLGLDSTAEVGMEDMLHHAKAVCRGVEQTAVIADMPSGSYADNTSAAANAWRFLDEAGCDAVKLEWFDGCPETVAALSGQGIPVMGHIGLTPQTAETYSVQGKDIASAKAIWEQARILTEKGCFAIVLECVPAELARVITEEISIPTIGIGAGVHCDGQVLVTHDLLGLYDRFQPKFVKRYAGLADGVGQALEAYAREVDEAIFPGPQESYSVDPGLLDQLRD